MQSELDSHEALRAGYFMGLAIDKAHRCSPYSGIGCVVTTANNLLIRTGAQRLGEPRHLLSILYDKIHESNTIAYLTQEPYLLGELAERELLALLPALGVGQIYIANPAPGRFEGRWCNILKSNGIKVEVGVGQRNVGLPARIGEKLVNAGRPWVTCVLFLDEKERGVSCKSFERDFGFDTDLAKLISCHSVLLSTRSRNGFSGFFKQYLSKRIFPSQVEPIIVNLHCDLASEAGYRELMEVQRLNAMAVMLLPVSTSAFLALDKHGLVDELIVYQSGCDTVAETGMQGTAHIKLVPDGHKWHLQDYSPLGDSRRFVYRTIRVEPGSALH